LVRARQRVEKCGFSAVWIAGESDFDLFFHKFVSISFLKAMITDAFCNLWLL
jgi:hypothetical protein